MSEDLERVGKHPAGYWATPASVMAKSFLAMLESGPAFTTLAPVVACRDITEFFEEVEEAIEKRSDLHFDTYQLAVRVLASCCYDSSSFMTLTSIEDFEMTLHFLADRFRSMIAGQTTFSDAEFEEVLQLTAFLERLCTLDESSSFDEQGGIGIGGLRVTLQ